jgi:hypothetical protein
MFHTEAARYNRYLGITFLCRVNVYAYKCQNSFSENWIPIYWHLNNNEYVSTYTYHGIFQWLMLQITYKVNATKPQEGQF